MLNLERSRERGGKQPLHRRIFVAYPGPPPAVPRRKHHLDWCAAPHSRSFAQWQHLLFRKHERRLRADRRPELGNRRLRSDRPQQNTFYRKKIQEARTSRQWAESDG